MFFTLIAIYPATYFLPILAYSFSGTCPLAHRFKPKLKLSFSISESLLQYFGLPLPISESLLQHFWLPLPVLESLPKQVPLLFTLLMAVK
jgi:hypothetical protein